MKQPLSKECVMKLFSIVVLLVLIFKVDAISYTCPFETFPDGIKGGKTSSDKCISIVTHEYVKKYYGAKGNSTETGALACQHLFKNGAQMVFRNESDLIYNRYVKMLEDEYFLVHAGMEQMETSHYYTKNLYSPKLGYTILFYCYDYKMRKFEPKDFFMLTRCYTYKHVAMKGYVYDGMRHPWLDVCHIHSPDCNDADKGFFPKCRCLQFRKQPILKYEKLFACQIEGCTYYACMHDAYRNCEEDRVRNCSIVPGKKECREYTYILHSHQEKPFGKPCRKRDYGNTCKCPCSNRPWSSWSQSSHTCGKGYRQKSKPRVLYENENVNCNQQPEKCCIKTESIQLSDCLEKFVHSGLSLEKGSFICMQNGGVPIQTDEGYICKCEDPLKHGYMCEYEHDICQKYQGICQNGGTCKGKGRSYYCICPTVKGCAHENMCQNGGTCVENENGLSCNCRYPYTGEFCETRMLVCPPRLCKNGGTCTAFQELQGFLCTCAERYTGKFCETLIMDGEPPENLMNMIGLGIVGALVLIAIVIYVVHRIKERERVMLFIYILNYLLINSGGETLETFGIYHFYLLLLHISSFVFTAFIIRLFDVCSLNGHLSLPSTTNAVDEQQADEISTTLLYAVSVEKSETYCSQYPAWLLYFPWAKFEQNSELHVLVNACSRVLEQSDRFCYSLNDVLRSRRFMIDFSKFSSALTAEHRTLISSTWTDHQADSLICAIGLAMHTAVVDRLRSRLCEKLADRAEQLLHGDAVQFVQMVPKINARLYNLEKLTNIRQLDFTDCGRLVSVVGVVIKAASVEPKCTACGFQCQSCGFRFQALLVDGLFSTPTRCPSVSGECRGRVFEPVVDTVETLTETVDCQLIRLQELLPPGGNSATGTASLIPKTIDCELTDDLVSTCSPGSVITLTGILKICLVFCHQFIVLFIVIRYSGVVRVRKNEEARRRGQCQYFLYLHANSVIQKEDLFGVAAASISFSSSEARLAAMSAVGELMGDRNLFSRLVASLCPTIYGHEAVKAGLVLALFGGATPSQQHSTTRSNIHALLVGDPGLGKTHLLQACADLSSRGVYVCASTTTAAGLTVTLGRGVDGDATVEAGALVLANDGCCCIDEFDKLHSHQQCLLEAMEQQELSVCKAGARCQFSARVSVVAACNPAKGHYEPRLSLTANVNVGPALLSRFDLIFLLVDKPDQQADRRLSEHVLAIRRPHSARLTDRLAAPDPIGAVPAPLFRQYVAFARQTVPAPKLSRAACRLLLAFFRRQFDQTVHVRTPVGVRQMESLIRLTQARAKCQLRSEATEQDAADVLEIVGHCPLLFAGTDRQSGNAELENKAGSEQRLSFAGRFLQALKRKAAQTPGSKGPFTRAELKAIASEVNNNSTTPTSQSFDQLIDKLNNAGLLLLEKPNCFKLQLDGID
ncbi:DNA replication licensing factor MCM8 [Trichinella spiralis]|uniref:DNA replication licensing factor MCM8 n=1 Tax=Trichinella spiralis TaxID=6334 RepID=UPI0001EFCC58|nr:DNA replication licensing factor MCM8 [Trichinella spiralis]